MSDIDLVQYGVLKQKVDSMEAKIDKMESQLDTLIELANRGRGGFWMGMVFVSAISTFVGYITHYWSKWNGFGFFLFAWYFGRVQKRLA